MNPRIFMQRALELAELGKGTVRPNPLVGCVIVHEGKIIGEGYHQQYGGPHAEVHAIASVINPALRPDSTVYVTLEPCNHHGRTGPCSQALIEAGVKEVFYAAPDPSPVA
jgi:diaminohydroxyphosphoribosylaminopyrimidine deaminase/5-amino-6-(5-phosphoribosylamino)uracil reductase